MMKNIINEHMLNDPEFIDGIKVLYDKKSLREILLKAAEEASELATKLLQHANKKPHEFIGSEIHEEIADVQMHLILLQQFYLAVKNKEIAAEKINKFLKSKNLKKYKDKKYEPITIS